MSDDLKLPKEITDALDAYDVEASEDSSVRSLPTARATVECAIATALREAPIAAIRSLVEKLADGTPVIRLDRARLPPLAFGKPRSTAPSCSACRDDRHEACGGPESGCGCAADGHGDPKSAPSPLPPEPEIPAPRDLARALSTALDRLGPAGDEAACHDGICNRKKCARCSAIDGMNALLDRVPKEWLR